MTTITVTKNNYTVDPLYQWDLYQTLKIYGLSLARAPEIHFAYGAAEQAIVKQATMDAAGVISVQVPNVLLQRSGKLHAYVYVTEGATERTVCEFCLQVTPRAKPEDYLDPGERPNHPVVTQVGTTLYIE